MRVGALVGRPVARIDPFQRRRPAVIGHEHEQPPIAAIVQDTDSFLAGITVASSMARPGAHYLATDTSPALLTPILPTKEWAWGNTFLAASTTVATLSLPRWSSVAAVSMLHASDGCTSDPGCMPRGDTVPAQGSYNPPVAGKCGGLVMTGVKVP